MAKIKLQIKSRWAVSTLFEYEKEDNTIKDTLIEAVKSHVNLSDADLHGANLCSANLCSANLRYVNLSDADILGADLRGANLCGANLHGANLCSANICGANICGANLRGANIRGANLRDADLRNADLLGADLRGANLRGANLRGANLRDADLRGADIRNADLFGVDLRDAGLRNADLRDAKEFPYIPLACPSDGAFIGWKKVKGCLVQLLVPEDAKRCSATSQKCRCEFARVVSITCIENGKELQSIENTSYFPYIVYKVGEIVKPDSFDENRWNECSHGIHFFINKQDAINY